MSVTIYFYSPYTQAVGASTGQIKVPGLVTAAELAELLMAAYPNLRHMLENELPEQLCLVRDGQVIRRDDRIKDGDELHLFAPISSG